MGMVSGAQGSWSHCLLCQEAERKECWCPACCLLCPEVGLLAILNREHQLSQRIGNKYYQGLCEGFGILGTFIDVKDSGDDGNEKR